MKSLLGPVLGKAPVPMTSSRGGSRGLIGGGHTATGFLAQLATFTTNSTINGLVSRTSTAASQVEWKLYRKAKSGKKEDREEVTSHAALDLWNKPNPFMTQQEFVEVAQQHLDLTGESPWVIAYHERAKNLPLELWPVRPDRMEPDPDPQKFLLGWTYMSPDGDKIPLGLKEVIHLRVPNPLDPYRGCSPIMTLLITIDRAKAAAEWNRNFFKNSARPGGIIEVDKRLTDDEFDEMSMRWAEQHRGVGNAHKVAILEHGSWKDIGFNVKDLQFSELHNLDRDQILEAFGFPKAVLGIVEDVNRANAETSEYIFARWLTVPRLERFKQALNNDLLPLYGDTARDLEFDYVSPVPSDEEAENKARDSKVAAFKVLVVDCGVDPEAAAEVVGLPVMEIREYVEVPEREQAPPAERVDDAQWSRIVAGLVRDTAEEPAPEVDLSAVDEAWTAALSALLLQWTSVVADWITQLISQIRSVLESGSRAGLADLKVATATATGVLQDAQLRLGETSARQVVREAADQDVDLAAVFPARDDYADDAALTVNLLARGLETSAAREAQRLAGPEPDVTEVVEGVRQHLESLTDAEPKRVLGGALHGAVNAGRAATFAAGPLGSIYATEKLDRNTCLAPNALVTTARGEVRADEVTLADKLLTHSGQWSQPSRIVVSDVSEDLVVATLSNGRTLRVTDDHPVLVVEGDVLVWRQAGQLAAGSLVVGQASLEGDHELVVPDLVLRQAPHGVAPVNEIGGLPLVYMRPERVPVAAIGLDDQSGTDEEVNGPRADGDLRGMGEAKGLQLKSDDPLDARLQTARNVAARRTVTTVLSAARTDAEGDAAVFARDMNGRPTTGLGAVSPHSLVAVAESCAATAAYSGASARVSRAFPRTVVVASGVRDGDLEPVGAMRTDLLDSVGLATQLGAHVGIGELACSGAVDGPVLGAASDLAVTPLAECRRDGLAPTLSRTTSAATTPLLGNPCAAVNTRHVHDLSLVEVVAVQQERHVGHVYDFTIPGDETFWTEGVLVHNCSPCREIDGRFICTTDDLSALYKLYPLAGYVDCEGGIRCRGTFTGAWRPQTGEA